MCTIRGFAIALLLCVTLLHAAAVAPDWAVGASDLRIQLPIDYPTPPLSLSKSITVQQMNSTGVDQRLLVAVGVRYTGEIAQTMPVSVAVRQLDGRAVTSADFSISCDATTSGLEYLRNSTTDSDHSNDWQVPVSMVARTHDGAQSSVRLFAVQSGVPTSSSTKLEHPLCSTIYLRLPWRNVEAIGASALLVEVRADPQGFNTDEKVRSNNYVLAALALGDAKTEILSAWSEYAVRSNVGLMWYLSVARYHHTQLCPCRDHLFVFRLQRGDVAQYTNA